MTVTIGNPEKTNQKIKDIISLVKINEDYLNNSNDFREYIIKSVNNSSAVLDVGKSMRNKYEKLNVKKKIL